MNITLGSSELCGIFDFDEDNEEKVVPHVVLSADVVIKRHMLVLKGLPLKTCHTKILTDWHAILMMPAQNDAGIWLNSGR